MEVSINTLSSDERNEWSDKLRQGLLDLAKKKYGILEGSVQMYNHSSPYFVMINIHKKGKNYNPFQDGYIYSTPTSIRVSITREEFEKEYGWFLSAEY
ncbi:hypothetical protein CEW46_27645 [Bacillus cereus]|nr:hypothetical protein CEW46_27645 [Bacillus cereus]